MRLLRSKRTHDQLNEQQGNRIKPVDQTSNLETFDRGDRFAQTPGNVSLKEKANTNGETPRKRLRTVSRVNPSNVSYNTRAQKRRAELDTETPNKRHKHEAPSSKSRVSEERTNSEQGKRKACTEEESSSKRRRVSETKESVISLSSSSSSSKEKPETSLFQSNTNRDDFEEKYKMLHIIGEGGFGCVYAGIRIADSLPVAIKSVSGWQAALDMKMNLIPKEVALLQRAAGGPESIGKHAAVTLLDWYYLGGELLIVMERPPSAVNLLEYSWKNSPNSSFNESTAKNFMAQMVDAAIDLNNKGVCHQDLKFANILVEEGQTPRLRIVDFGCGSFVEEGYFRSYNDTVADVSEWLNQKRSKAEPATVWQLGALLYRMLYGRLFDPFRFLQDEVYIKKTQSPDCFDFLQKCVGLGNKQATLEQLRLHSWLQ